MSKASQLIQLCEGTAATKADAAKAAKKYGCELDAVWDTFDWQINLWAPKGKIFSGSGCHVDSSLSGEYSERSFDWTPVIQSIKEICSEVEKCTDDDCEVCNPD